MKGTLWIAAAALLLGGCASERVRLDEHGRAVLELDQVTDAQLRERGEWTAADAEARRLIGPERGASGQYRPVRRPPVAQKLAGVSAAVLTLCGWSYEKPYHYVPEERTFVFVHRGKPASIVNEAWQGRFGDDEPAPVLSPDEEKFERWTREELERVLPTTPEVYEEGPVPISRVDLR